MHLLLTTGSVVVTRVWCSVHDEVERLLCSLAQRFTCVHVGVVACVATTELPWAFIVDTSIDSTFVVVVVLLTGFRITPSVGLGRLGRIG